MKHMEMERSTADPCLYHKWTDDGLVQIVSQIDDNLIMGSEKATKITNSRLMDRFEYTDEGELTEFVGSKIDRTDNGGLKFTQPVLIQSFKDKFDLPTQMYNTPAKAGKILTKCKKSNALNDKDQMIYQAEVGKTMYLMQYSRAEIYNLVRDCACHMQMATKSIWIRSHE